MSKLKIYTDKDSQLRAINLEVSNIDDSIKAEISDMVETLRSLNGYGLAAPQVGINKKIVIIESKPTYDEEGTLIDEGVPLMVLINPEITKFSKEQCEFEEGCFSVPNFRGIVTRPKKVKVVAKDINNKNFQVNASGLMARVLQHEIDHLNGIIFTDLIKDKTKLIPSKPDETWQEALDRESK
jgi:peptide deformylase